MYICTKNKLCFKKNKIKFMQKIKVRTNSAVTPQAVSKSFKGIDKNNAEQLFGFYYLFSFLFFEVFMMSLQISPII